MNNNLLRAVQALSQEINGTISTKTGTNYPNIVQPPQTVKKIGQLQAAIEKAEILKRQEAQQLAWTAQNATWDARQKIINTNKEELQKTIKSERLGQGMTQRDLATKCGLSQGTITRAERNGYISFSCLMQIASGLGRKVIIN